MSAAHEDHEDDSHGQGRWELYFAIASGVTYIAGLIAEFGFGAPEPLVLGLYLATYFCGGFFTVRGAWGSIRRGRFEVDFLMIVAAAGDPGDACTLGRNTVMACEQCEVVCQFFY